MKRTASAIATAVWMIFPAFLQAQTPAQTPASAPPAAQAATSSSAPAAGAATAPARPAPLMLPAGATVHVRLGTTLTSKTSKTGDKFTGLVTEAVSSGDKVVVPEGSFVDGHVAMVKSSGRIAGRAQMRVVLDDITTPNNQKIDLSAGLQDADTGKCMKASGDDEGTLKGCGKSKKDAAKDAGIVGAVGASAGASVGLGSDIECRYYGICGGPGIAESAGYGAAIGAGTALIYNLFKHEKQIILVEGTNLSFVVNRSVAVPRAPAGTATSDEDSESQPRP